MNIVMPTLLGVEALVANQLQDLGYAKSLITVKDGQVYLQAGDKWQDVSAIVADLNVNLSFCERVEVELFSGRIDSFDDMFDLVKAYPWEDIIAVGSAFIVAGGYSRKSKIFGISAAQSIIKKAIIARLLEANNLPQGSFLTENPDIQELRLQFSVMNDIFSLRFDTTGAGLHKRGYRIKANLAPLKETLAASLLSLTKFRPFTDEVLWDPFCGSGTILIEAARLACNVAPGMRRNFAAERMRFFSKKDFDTARTVAENKADFTPPDVPFFYGTDIDAAAIKVAQDNARRAGVSEFIKFEVADVKTIQSEAVQRKFSVPYVTIITNPPYGERLLDDAEAHKLISELGPMFFTDSGLKSGLRLHILSADDKLEEALKFKADKRRKLYNGMIACQFYQFFRKTGQPFRQAINRNQDRREFGRQKRGR